MKEQFLKYLWYTLPIIQTYTKDINLLEELIKYLNHNRLKIFEILNVISNTLKILAEDKEEIIDIIKHIFDINHEQSNCQLVWSLCAV